MDVWQRVGNDRRFFVFLECGRAGFPGIKIQIPHAHALHEVKGVSTHHDIACAVVSAFDHKTAGAFLDTFFSEPSRNSHPLCFEIDIAMVVGKQLQSAIVFHAHTSCLQCVECAPVDRFDLFRAHDLQWFEFSGKSVLHILFSLIAAASRELETHSTIPLFFL